jgi:hypothetical protein
MEEIHTIIGDHFIHVIYESKKLTSFFLRNFQISQNHSNKWPDLVITIKEGYGIPFLDYDVKTTTNHNHILYQRADYQVKVDLQYKSATISIHDELALKHALMNLYSSFIVYHNWGLLIHSSCAIENGKAHIFAGQSGSGKSTAAKLSYPRNLLSDEATLVKITPERVVVFNSPFRSELETGNFGEHVELASVQILYQAMQNNRYKLTKSNGLLDLMDKVFFWPNSREETKTVMRLLTDFVKTVPVYNLHFQKNNTFWELIS